MQVQQAEPPVSFHLKWVATAALIIGITATVGLLLAILLITDDKGGDYAQVIGNHSLTQENLGVTLLVFGLALVILACATTWLIALYSSFRVAGPLFRFSQNLKAIIDDAFALPLAIRQTDLLQREWTQFDSSQAKLREHYARLRQAIAACQQAAAPGIADNSAALQQALVKLQEVESRVQL